MPFKDKKARRLAARNSMRRKRALGFTLFASGQEREDVNPSVDTDYALNVNPSPDKRDVNPWYYPAINFKLKSVVRLMEYLGLTEEELIAGTTIAHVGQYGHNLLVYKPRTGEIIGMIPEKNARGLTAIWERIAKLEADAALHEAQTSPDHTAEPYGGSYTGIYTWTDTEKGH